MNPICGLETIGLCIPLLAIVCALSTRGAALVTAVTRDTGQRVSAVVCECICRGWNGMDCTPCLRCVKMSVQSLNVSVRRQKVGIERTYRLEISSRALGVGCSCCNLSLEVGVVKASQNRDHAEFWSSWRGSARSRNPTTDFHHKPQHLCHPHFNTKPGKTSRTMRLFPC